MTPQQKKDTAALRFFRARAGAEATRDLFRMSWSRGLAYLQFGYGVNGTNARQILRAVGATDLRNEHQGGWQ